MMKFNKINKINTRKSIKDYKKCGFTLAETLVTMAIIGVLAAIMIPTMISLKPNKEMVMLKKAYEMTSRVINELINDEELYENEQFGFLDYGVVEYHGEPINSGETFDKDLVNSKTGKAAEKFCHLFAARMNLSGTVDCTKLDDGDGNISESNRTFMTSDGMLWLLPDFSRNTFTITVNVTPDRKGKASCKESTCPDDPNIFDIQFNEYGRITVPANTDGSKSAAQLYLSSNKTTKTLAELRELDKKN